MYPVAPIVSSAAGIAEPITSSCGLESCALSLLVAGSGYKGSNLIGQVINRIRNITDFGYK